MSKFWVLGCILSLISCVNKQEEDYIVAVEEITFPGVKGYVESYYYDSLENKEYLSFFTIRSVDDSLKVFEFPSANFLYSVPMYALWDTLNGLPMRSFKMIGVDTFCISAEENIFVFLNKEGRVYKWLDM